MRACTPWLLLVSSLACASPSTPLKEHGTSPAPAIGADGDDDGDAKALGRSELDHAAQALVADAAANERAEQARGRLQKTDAGRIVLASTAYHGGLSAWFAGRALSFRYAYKPESGRGIKDTKQTIDLLRSRAYHVALPPMSGRFAFDGEKAWSTADPKFPARFWALTPYYFVGMPFVLGDPGVRLKLVKDDPAQVGLREAIGVRATFEEGVGDAPDDYYVLYFHAKTHALLGLRYVVTYAPFFASDPDRRVAERLLVYENEEPVGPLRLATRHRTYAFADGRRGALITVSDVSDLAYGATFDEAALVMPADARIDPGPAGETAAPPASQPASAP